jgi:F-type H+-transporting ATPase subunit delta
MKNSIVVLNKYANALADLSLDEATLAQLKLVKEVFEQNPLLESVLANPSIKSTNKKNIISELFASKLSALVLHTIYLLIDKRRMSLIVQLYDAYLKIFLQRSNIALVEIHSATSLESALLTEISDRLAAVLAKSVELVNHIDISLLAGYKVKVDSKVLDLSLKSKLRQMQDLLV